MALLASLNDFFLLIKRARLKAFCLFLYFHFPLVDGPPPPIILLRFFFSSSGGISSLRLSPSLSVLQKHPGLRPRFCLAWLALDFFVLRSPGAEAEMGGEEEWDGWMDGVGRGGREQL